MGPSRLGEPVWLAQASLPFIRVYKFNQLAQILQSASCPFLSRRQTTFSKCQPYTILTVFSLLYPKHYPTFSVEVQQQQVSMKNTRPYTAQRQTRNSKVDSRVTSGQTRRPLSAKSDSLKKIIQVIENTLSKGAQTLQTKTKTLDKFSKVKNQSLDFSHFKLFKLRPRYEREIPQFRTEFLIGNTSEIARSTPTIKSSKKLFTSHQNDEFVPYSKQPALLEADQHSRREGAQLKKVCRKRANLKENAKINDGYNLCEIDKWNNESSIMNMSYLLDQHRQ